MVGSRDDDDENGYYDAYHLLPLVIIMISMIMTMITVATIMMMPVCTVNVMYPWANKCELVGWFSGHLGSPLLLNLTVIVLMMMVITDDYGA